MRYPKLFNSFGANKSNKPLAIITIAIVAAIGTYLLISSHAATPYASINADKGTLSNGATIVTDNSASDGKYVKFGTVPPAGGGGNGTLLFNGTFASDAPGSNWPSIYPGSNGTWQGNCLEPLNTNEMQFNISSACAPSDDAGHWRTDLCTVASCDNDTTGDYYVAGQITCTSVPIKFINTASFTGTMFAEAKDNEAGMPGWSMDITSYYGPLQVQLAFPEYESSNNPGGVGYIDPSTLDSNWHTWSICTNNANDSSGVVESIWKDGVRLKFNYGTQSGSQSLSGFSILDDGAKSWPLDINDYAGDGTGAANSLIHGAPLISTMGSNGLPPEPSGSWNNP
jgi:hypothetical protein